MAGAAMILVSAAIIGVARAQDMLNNTPDYVGAWYLGDIMRYRGETSEEKPRDGSRLPEEKPKNRAQSSGTSRATLLEQASYAPSESGTRAINTAFADFLSGKRIDGSPELLRALAADNPGNSPFVPACRAPGR